VGQLQLAGRESRAKFLSHHLPLRTFHEEQPIGDYVQGRVLVETAVHKVREILDQYIVDQLRIADHQERRLHLIETAVFLAGKPFVNPVNGDQLVFDQSHHLHRVAHQWPRWVVGYFQLQPLVVRVGRVIVKDRREDSDYADCGCAEQKIDQTRNHGDVL